MDQKCKHVVWTWLDTDGKPVYVGWGKFEKTHPAKIVWAGRNSYESELNTWLRSLKNEPKRATHTTSIPLRKQDARAMARAICERHRKADESLLDSRPDGTKLGGGGRRQVLSPELTVYPSVRQAAIDVGVNACTITRWCQEAGTDWDYLT